jgi:peptidoglycan hydrolase-like protein with peptidoglycan-binding domain
MDDAKKVLFRGRKLNAKTILMLQSAERRMKRRFLITQGSFNAGVVDASAGTHDGGGVLDLHAGPLTVKQVRVLRKAGFAAWHRLPSDFPKNQHVPEHVHAVSLFDTALSDDAKNQRKRYLESPRRNGLKNNAKDTGPFVLVPEKPVLVRQTVRRREILFGQPRNESVAYLQDMMGIFPDGVFGKQTRKAAKARFGWNGKEPMDGQLFRKVFPSSVFKRDAALQAAPTVKPARIALPA